METGLFLSLDGLNGLFEDEFLGKLLGESGVVFQLLELRGKFFLLSVKDWVSVQLVALRKGLRALFLGLLFEFFLFHLFNFGREELMLTHHNQCSIK